MSSLDHNKQWRSLAELQGDPEFEKFLATEFPDQQEQLLDPVSRRRFMQLMGASLAFAGVSASGCRRWEEEEIVPLPHRPEGYVPGVPKHYASAHEIGGVGEGLLVTCYDGRPIKIEGNPDHPYTGSASTAFAQASILELYDPDRSRGVARHDNSGQRQSAHWNDFLDFARALPKSARVHVLSEATSSPTIERLVGELSGQFSQGFGWHEYEPLSADNERQGTEMAFGTPMRAIHHVERARSILALDSDFLVEHPAALKHAADFASVRNPEVRAPRHFARLWSVESTFSRTGGVADHRLPLRSELILPFVLALEATLTGKTAPQAAFLAEPHIKKFFDALVADFKSRPTPIAGTRRGPANLLLVAGQRQPAAVHAVVARLNRALNRGSSRRPVEYAAERARPTHFGSIKQLTTRMNAGNVDVLVILGGNPVFNAPGDVNFAEALKRVKTSIHLSSYNNETSAACNWHIPRAHFLESWGDTRSYDGTITFIQPTVRPLRGGKTAIEVLAILAREADPSGKTQVRRTFDKRQTYSNDAAWRTVLQKGFVPNSKWPTQLPDIVSFEAPLSPSQKAGTQLSKNALEVVFTPSSHTYDGRFANNGWLQETPDFMTKLTWDNAALVGPSTAAALGIKHDTLINVTIGANTLRIPAYVMPGQAPFSIALAVGHGRSRAGYVGGHQEEGIAPAGTNAYPLRTQGAMYIATGASVGTTSTRGGLVGTQDHWAIDELGRKSKEKRAPKLVKTTAISEYRKDKEFAKPHMEFGDESLWDPPTDYSKRKWGMATDLGKCIGCNSCMVACQAENNIPVVGKEQVAMSREMHWIRIDRYFSGHPDNPEISHQPVVCQQCENAPCEQVCPVGATIHTDEGLNDMVYNRCIGTRYCLNNCPYKVRRFNFLDYHKLDDPRKRIRKLLFNPEVTVRSRGVMEKCTFCVQRIEAVKITANNERRKIADGEIKTACQQACPTGAIVFGDLNDKNSEVSKHHREPRAYPLLAGLLTAPRNLFLARIKNPFRDLG